MAKKGTKKVKKQGAVARYFREVRAEVSKVVWPSWPTARNLSLIVIGVTTVMSGFLGLVDLVFTRVFSAIISS